jgi:hypothetical protein
MEILRALARKQGCTILLVTHDARILDIADRVLTLEDGRMTAHDSVLTADSVNLLTALSYNSDSAELKRLWDQLDETGFLDMLQKLRAESDQFLNVTDLQETSVQGFFEALLESVFLKVAEAIGAASASLRAGEEVMLRIGGLDDDSDRGELAMPIRNRADSLIATAHFTAKSGGKAFSDADRRALSDFERPLGSLLEACLRMRLEARLRMRAAESNRGPL